MLTIIPFLDEYLQLIGVFVIVVDVTETVATRKKIEQAVTSRDNFMAMASHELRTPITTLMITNQLQRKKIQLQGQALSKEELWNYLQQEHKQFERLGRLVEDMLDISRIDNKKLDLKLQDLNFSHFLVETMEKFRPQLESHGMKLHINVVKDLMKKVDPDRMEQVLTNLTTNAIRYAKGSELWVNLKQERDGTVLLFEDSGQGIPEDKLEIIFERFEQGTESFGGFGVGLYISKDIVLSHGGKITASNRNPHGAVFKIILP